jgi:C1A family cysteine protease
MSKTTFIVASIAVIALIGAFVGQSTQRNLMAQSDSSVQDLWAHWKAQYGKAYATAEEEAHKFAVFTDNFNFVTQWNADPSQTSSVGLNEFADLNTAEFGALKGCLNMRQPSSDLAVESVLPFTQDGELPASVDWRAKGAVTPIKNQGQCGSCWSFSTTGVLEGLNFINNGDLLSFSEQQLVDCSQKYGNQGCDGGWPFWALEYTAAEGIELESQYPYKAVDTKCTYNAADVKFKNQGYANVTVNNEVAMATALVSQPISVCVEADQSVF